MKLYIKTLTPLHIGTGNELEPIDYVISDKKYYRIPQKVALAFIRENNLLIPYIKWINETAETINALEERKQRDKKNRDLNQQLSDLRKNFTLLEFYKQNRAEQKFISFIQKSKSVTTIPLNGQTPDRKIREQLKDGTGTPYLPGTSIKGAIRTALMYHWLVNKKPVNEIKQIFEKDLQIREKPEKLKVIFANKIENLAFYCGIDVGAGRIKNDDEKFDLLKLLSVSDGKIIPNGNPLSIVRTFLYLRDNTRQGQSPWVEAIAAGQTIEFSIDFNIEFLYTLKDKIHNDSITIDRQRQWLGIATKTKELFNLDIATLTKENLEEQKQNVLTHILNTVYAFSKKQMQWNEQWKSDIKPKQQRGGGKPPQLFDKNKVDFTFAQNKNCINLGFASGFSGITELLYLLGNRELKESFKRVMENFGIGKHSKQKVFNPNPDKFPKSKTMYETKDKIQPLGWGELLTKYEPKTQASGRQQDTASPSESSSAYPPPQPEKPKPRYYTGKIKAGVIVNAYCTGTDPLNPKMKKFKLLLGEPGSEPVVTLSYASNIAPDKLIEVKITGIQKDKITTVQFVRFV